MAPETPTEVLKMRFVKGEITQEQYRAMLSEILPPELLRASAGPSPPGPAAAAAPAPTGSINWLGGLGLLIGIGSGLMLGGAVIVLLIGGDYAFVSFALIFAIGLVGMAIAVGLDRLGKRRRA